MKDLNGNVIKVGDKVKRLCCSGEYLILKEEDGGDCVTVKDMDSNGTVRSHIKTKEVIKTG